jgi:putative oxidoreductase
MSKRTQNIIAWIGSIVVAAMVGLPGFDKLASSANWVEQFEGWGLPGSMVMIVGAMELGGAILLLIPKFAKWGGVAVAMAMLGASGTHLLNAEAARAPFSLVLAAITLGVAFSRHRQQQDSQ